MKSLLYGRGYMFTMKERTLMKYRSHEGERVRVTFVSGRRRAIAENFYRDGSPKEDTGRCIPIREVRIYEGNQLYESIEVKQRCQFPVLKGGLEHLTEQALEVDEIAIIIKDVLDNDIVERLAYIEFIDRYYPEHIANFN